MVIKSFKARQLDQAVLARRGVVGLDHFLDQFLERGRRHPTQLFLGLGRIAQQGFHLGRAVVARVDLDDHVAHLALGAVTGDRSDDADFLLALALEAHRDTQLGRRALDELAHAVLHAGGDDEVFRLVLLQHQPLHLDIVARVAPVAQRAHVAQVQAVLQSQRDARDGAGDLARHEGLAAQRALVVEQHAVAGVDAIGLAVVDRDPVGVHLRHRVGAARVERRRLLLRNLLHQAVQLRGRGLIEARLLRQAQDADRLQDAQRADAVGVGGVFRLLEGHRHMAHRRQVVDLVGLDLLDDAHQAGRVGQVTVVQREMPAVDMRILVQVVDAVGVEQAGATLDAVDLVALLQQQFGQIRAVLAGDAGDEGNLGRRHGAMTFSI